VGDGTKIEWATATWNPIIGCSRTSPGCDHCYAIGVVHRGMSEQHRGLTVKAPGEPVDWTGEIRTVPHLLDQPLRWTRPRRIFVNSLSDLFHENLPVDEIAKVFAVMQLASQHTFQVLTKRAQRMRRVLLNLEFPRMVDDHRERLRPECGDFTWPLPNVWLGVSIESDRYAFRARHLVDAPAAVRWVSAEPLLGPVPSLDLNGIDWVVAGGESGAQARPMHPDWVIDLRDRCVTAGVAFFLKQWGEYGPSWTVPDPKPGATVFVDRDGNIHSADLADIAPSGWCGMNKAGKTRTGRELEGRTWDEYPA